jgi:maltose alpha-D-glucosyltransferase/alpha-amylase
VEREGTTNENLPETHQILKRFRDEIDRNYFDRILLAEVNQWPEEVKEYFGEGDECHMAFHFPLMPRMYMAIAREDRLPIGDIIRQTPAIPAWKRWSPILLRPDGLYGTRPLRADCEHVADDEHPDHQHRIYRWSSGMRIVRRQLGPNPRQIENAGDGAYQVR